MRQYRGRIKDSTVWVYGYYTKSPQGIARIWSHITKDNGESYLYDYVVDPETVGQSTGLKDKNGKEIYEGDVLQRKSSFTGKIHYQQVKWDQENARYLATSKQLQENLAGALERGYEWAGTIYEHPHLLKGDENE